MTTVSATEKKSYDLTGLKRLPTGDYESLGIGWAEGPGRCVCEKAKPGRRIWWFGSLGSCHRYLKRLRAGEVEIEYGHG